MGAIDTAALKIVDILFEGLDDGVTLFQVLVEAVALRDELLLPRPEALLLDLDLLREALPQSLFLLFELGIVQLPWAGFAELARLHLLRPVRLVVVLLGGVDKVQHVSSDEDGAQFLEVAVLLVLNLCNTPRVLTALDGTPIVRLHVLLRTNHGEWHGSNQAAGMLETSFIILLKRRLVNLNALGFNDSAYLAYVRYTRALDVEYVLVA